MHMSRRRFNAGLGTVAASLALPLRARAAGVSLKAGVISDEISQDFDHACYVIAKEWDLHFVELREVWGKNLQVISRCADRGSAEDPGEVQAAGN